MLDNLEAAIVHEPIEQKLSVFKVSYPAHRGPQWCVVDVPAGTVVGRCDTWADALEHAQTILAIREVCS